MCCAICRVRSTSMCVFCDCCWYVGVVAQELAGTAHYDVMRELLATTEAKVMLAIDEYNELFQMSQWHYGDNKASVFCLFV